MMKHGHVSMKWMDFPWGFGFFETRSAMGAYNRERKAAILRKFTNDKDAIWGGGLRVPIGNRISHDAASLTWRTTNTDKPGGDVLTLPDCKPVSYESYDSFTADGGNLRPGESSRRLLTHSHAPQRNMSICFLSFSAGGKPRGV